MDRDHSAIHDEESGPHSAEHRLALLIERLMQSMEAAASTEGWDEVATLADDVLAVDPDNRRAAELLYQARAGRPVIEGQRAFVSLLFADIVKSTVLTDVTEPEIVRNIFALYRQAATEAIEGLDGRVLQFQGDGIVACFGYPNAHEDDARRAVLGGLGLVERMAAHGPELNRRYGVEIALRVGIHSGTVVITELTPGSADASDVVGMAANLASRLQSEAGPGAVVISDATMQLVEGHFDLEPLGTRRLAGIARPTGVFRVVRPRPDSAGWFRGDLQLGALIGRRQESADLHRNWDELVSSASQRRPPRNGVVVVSGPAGIGKSRLTADLCDHVRADEGAVLEARCSPYHSSVALWPIGRMLEQRLGMYPEQPGEERSAEVERRLAAVGLDPDLTAPLLVHLLDLAVDSQWIRPELDAPALRAETLTTLVDWLVHFAETTPSMVLVEDLHWADPTTVELLELLIDRGAPGVLVVITTRSPVGANWEQHGVRVELGPLVADEAATLVEAVVPEGGLDPAQRRLITERGGGVPLFLQELARSALQGAPGEPLPPRLNELLTARLRSPGIDLRIVQLAATLGAEFEGSQLSQIAGGPVEDALERLDRAGIVEPIGDARRGSYRFRHGLLRDAAYETQVLESRRAAHSRIAALMQATAHSTGDLAIVAQHHDLASDAAEAVPAYIAAAQAAQAEASHTEARKLLDRALEVLMSSSEGDERDLTELMIRMLRTVSVSSLFGYGYPDVYEDFRLADGICQRLTDRVEIMPARVGIWSYLLVRGDVGSAGGVLEPLTTMLDATETAWFAPEVKCCLGYTCFYGGDLEGARHWLEEAWAGYLARPTDAGASPFWPLPHDPVPVTAVALACVAGLQGRTTECAEWEERATAAVERLGFPFGPFSSAFISTYLAWLRMITGDAAGARELGQRILDIAVQCRFDYFSVIGQQYVLIPEPDFMAEVDDLERCAAGMDLVGHRAFRPAFLGIVARHHSYGGNPDQALEAVEEALAGVARSGEWVHQPDLLRLRAQITASVHPERIDRVVSDLVDAVTIGSDQGSIVLALRAANDLARLPADVRPAGLDERLRDLLDQFPEGSTSHEIADALELLGA